MANCNLFLKSGFIRAPLQNGVGRYIGQLQRITIKFCKNNGSSRGIRDFIENDLVNFARDNPGVVVYVKPRRHQAPAIVAEYRKAQCETTEKILKSSFQWTANRISCRREMFRVTKFRSGWIWGDCKLVILQASATESIGKRKCLQSKDRGLLSLIRTHQIISFCILTRAWVKCSTKKFRLQKSSLSSSRRNRFKPKASRKVFPKSRVSFFVSLFGIKLRIT